MQWLETLKNISVKYALTEEQNQTLGTETTLALLGIINLDEYEHALETELQLDSVLAGKVVIDVNDQILADIRPDLRSAYAANKEEMDEAPASEQVSRTQYQDTLYEISRTHKLTIEQMGLLEKAVMGIMTGAMHAEDFPEKVEKSLGLTKEENASLVSDLNEKIFKIIRQGMMAAPEKSPVPAQPEAPAEHRDSDILKKAGIEIIPAELTSGKKESVTQTPPTPAPEVVQAMQVTPVQKLSEPVKTPVTKTEYEMKASASAANQPPDAQAPYQKGTDPYRMPIE